MSTTSTVSTILTCYSSLAPGGAAKPSKCAASGKRRRRRSIIDEEPRIEIEDGIKIEATSLSGKATNSKDNFKSIEPTRTVSEVFQFWESSSKVFASLHCLTTPI